MNAKTIFNAMQLYDCKKKKKKRISLLKKISFQYKNNPECLFYFAWDMSTYCAVCDL